MRLGMIFGGFAVYAIGTGAGLYIYKKYYSDPIIIKETQPFPSEFDRKSIFDQLAKNYDSGNI
jgi:hypothetical protein